LYTTKVLGTRSAARGASYIVPGRRSLVGNAPRFAYATGIKAPGLDQSFATAFTVANQDLKARRTGRWRRDYSRGWVAENTRCRQLSFRTTFATNCIYVLDANF